jgi:hypothetical protein
MIIDFDYCSKSNYLRFPVYVYIYIYEETGRERERER